jgi:drug/metabolite transporter (DMT)-like permease
MEEWAVRFAEVLEQIWVKIRSLTVDRVARGIRLTGLGILAATLGFSAVLFLFLAIFGALEIPLTTAGALAVVGVALIGGGSYLWIKRVE